METQQQAYLKNNDTQNIENSAFVKQSSRWKTGLSRFKNNISKPTLLVPPPNNQDNLTNQSSIANSENHQKVFIVDVEENNVSDSGLGKSQIVQNRKNPNSTYSKKTPYQTSTINHSNQAKKLFLSSSLVNTNSDMLNESYPFEDKRVHFNSEVSTNNELTEIQQPKTKNLRPKTQLLQKPSMLPQLQSNGMAKFGKAKTQPIYRNQSGSNPGSYDIVHKSFDAHFKRRKEAIDAFNKKDWQISERMYNMKVQKVHQLMNWKEFNPAAKVASFTDNYITEEVHEETRKEKKLNDFPDGTNFMEGRFKLPPERQLTVHQPNRVYFWG